MAERIENGGAVQTERYIMAVVAFPSYVLYKWVPIVCGENWNGDIIEWTKNVTRKYGKQRASVKLQINASHRGQVAL